MKLSLNHICLPPKELFYYKMHNLDIAAPANNLAPNISDEPLLWVWLFPVIIRIFQRCHLNLQHTCANDTAEIYQNEWAIDKKKKKKLDSIFMC